MLIRNSWSLFRVQVDNNTMPVEMEAEIGSSDDHDHFMEKGEWLFLGTVSISLFWLFLLQEHGS